MKRLTANCGSTATPSRPRSDSVQATVERSSAGVASSVPPLNTRSRPGWVAISIRPSGVHASAVGAATLVTTSSVKFAGSVTACAGGSGCGESRHRRCRRQDPPSHVRCLLLGRPFSSAQGTPAAGLVKSCAP